jgi:predicted transcriptional regulator
LYLRVLSVRRSKLEMYVDILSVLSRRGPLKLTHVMYKANVNCSVLKEYLDFLMKQELVDERPVGKRAHCLRSHSKGFNGAEILQGNKAGASHRGRRSKENTSTLLETSD